jgi:hypothetical protein
MSARDDLLSALSWPMTLERESVPEATRALRPVADMLDAFGWVAHPVRHGWIRWAAISRDGDAAIAEARAESPLLIVRHPGTPPAVISDRAHLFAELIGLARAGFGTMPSVSRLTAISVRLAAEAAGAPMDDASIAVIAAYLAGRQALDELRADILAGSAFEGTESRRWASMVDSRGE